MGTITSFDTLYESEYPSSEYDVAEAACSAVLVEAAIHHLRISEASKSTRRGAGSSGAASGKGPSTNLVCSLLGITPRQLDIWARKGWLGESQMSGFGSGRSRQFTADEVARLALLVTCGEVAGTAFSDQIIKVAEQLTSGTARGQVLVSSSDCSVTLSIDLSMIGERTAVLCDELGIAS